MSLKHRVVAAVDFGTHGSGFAWATVSRENDDLFSRTVRHFFQWKDQRTVYAKNRSALLVGPSGDLLAWGHEALRKRDSGSGAAGRLHTGFKMDLQTDLGDGLHDGDAADGTSGRDAYRLVVLCLREVFRAACADIVQGLYRADDIRWCITVPAIWDPFTTDLMYRAAVDAGFPADPDRLFLAREPAAAALYCLATGAERLRVPGTRYMVVDAGGGTVDIASYIVRGKGQLSELAKPSGAKKGSAYLNQAFMVRELERELGADQLIWLKRYHRQELSGLMEVFEQEKLSFDVDTRDDLRIDLGAQLYQTLIQQWSQTKHGPEPPAVLVLSRQRVADLFEDLLAEILDKIDAHLESMRALSGERGGEVVMLVGGFAQSPYLRSRLRDYVMGRDAEFIVPPRPELAVLSGAVHYAYDPDAFPNWRAPLTYGVKCSMPFRSGIDPENSRVQGPDGISLCPDRFSVLVATGQSVTASELITKRYFPVKNSSREITIRLLTSNRPDVQFASGDDVTETAKLSVDISSSLGIPREDRVVEITMQFGQSRILAKARDVRTGEAKSVDIKWRPTWW